MQACRHVQTLREECLYATGLPANDQFTFCPSAVNSTSCYFYNTSSQTYATHKSNCAKLGGYLISYNNPYEHLDVNSHYTRAGIGGSYVWIGLEKSGNLWYWLDGRPWWCPLTCPLCSAALCMEAVASRDQDGLMHVYTSFFAPARQHHM
jgi:hypothetical protein